MNFPTFEQIASFFPEKCDLKISEKRLNKYATELCYGHGSYTGTERINNSN